MSEKAGIVNLFIAGLLVAILIPVGLKMLWDVDTTGWNATLATIWNLLPLLSVVAVVIGAIYYVFKGRESFIHMRVRAIRFICNFLNDRRGEPGGFTAGVVISTVIIMLIFAILIPVAVQQLTNANVSVPSTEYGTKPHYLLVMSLIQYVLPLVIIISLAVWLIKRMGG
jgi:hypothetical protein